MKYIYIIFATISLCFSCNNQRQSFSRFSQTKNVGDSILANDNVLFHYEIHKVNRNE